MSHQMSHKSSTNLGKISRREGIFATLILSLVVLCALGAMSVLGGLHTQYSVKQFLPQNHPLMQADRETQSKFFLDKNVPAFATLDLSSGDWLETERLTRLAKVSSEIETVLGVKHVVSLGNVQSASQSQDELAVGGLLKLTSEGDRRELVRGNKFLTPLLISEDARRTVVAVTLDDEILSVEAMGTKLDQIRGRLIETFPEAKVSVGGVPAIQSRLAALVKSELVQFVAFALVASCLVLLAVFSSAWSALIPFGAILLSNIFVFAFMVLAGISMTALAVTIPILVSIIVLSLCVHTMLRFVEDVEKNEGIAFISPFWSRKGAMAMKTIRSLFLPNLLSALTTCFGFATLLPSKVPVIHDFGVSVSASVIISWLVTSLLIAPLLVLLPVPVARRWVFAEAKWVKPIFAWRRPLSVFVVLACVALALSGRQLHWSARLFDDLPKQEEARIATEVVDRSLGGTIPFDIVVARENVSEPWNDPSALAQLDQLLLKIRTRLEVGSAVGLPDLLRQAMGNSKAALPLKRSTIAENWFLLSMSEDSPLKLFLTPDGSSSRLSLRLRDLPSDRLKVVMGEILDEVRAAFPGASVSSAGLATTVHSLNDELSLDLMSGFWQALGIIALLLFLVFRSFRWTLAAVLPNLVPAAALVGVLALAKTPIKPGVALVFSIALGIAFNNTVYLLQRLRSLMKESGRGPGEEVENMLRLEGNACLISTLTVFCGFAIFLMSEFDINRTFGTYMLISLFCGAVGDIAFLPALIRWCPWILASTVEISQANLKVMEKEREMGVETLVVENEEKSILPRIAAGLAAVLIAATPVSPARAGSLNADTILKNVERQLSSKDELARIKMKVVESNGSSKERELVIKRKAGGQSQVLVRLKAPSDVNGIGLLSVAKGSSEDQWLYMPSQKKARRVVAGNRSQKFLDTEFSLEDFSASTYARFTNKIIKEERAPSAAVAVVESKAKDNSSSYGRILTWVDLGTYQVQKSEYYDHDGKIMKTMVFRDYKKYGNIWRAQTVEVRNMQNQRSTVLKVAALKLNSGISDREFTQSALEEGD